MSHVHLKAVLFLHQAVQFLLQTVQAPLQAAQAPLQAAQAPLQVILVHLLAHLQAANQVHLQAVLFNLQSSPVHLQAGQAQQLLVKTSPPPLPQVLPLVVEVLNLCYNHHHLELQVAVAVL